MAPIEPRWAGLGLGLIFLAAGAVLLLTDDDGAPPAVAAEQVIIEMDAFRYGYTPGSNESINVSRGSIVTLRITSQDVTHGLAITEYGINVEIPPGETVEVRFRADQVGRFQIYCTVFCGAGHPQHKGTLHVV